MLACLGFPVHFIPLSRCLLACGCDVCLSLVYVYSKSFKSFPAFQLMTVSRIL